MLSFDLGDTLPLGGLADEDPGELPRLEATDAPGGELVFVQVRALVEVGGHGRGR